jgi:NitT/TauT family transport system permease protein
MMRATGRRYPSVLWRYLWAPLTQRPEISLSLLFFIIVVGGWEAVVRLLQLDSIILPAPSAITVALWELVNSSGFSNHFFLTLYEILAGFALGAIFGLILGGVIGQFQILQKSLYLYIVAFQVMPKVAIAPLIVIWFGFGASSKVVITALIAFFPILANTIGGLQAAPAEQIELMIAYKASRWQIFWKVRVPQALPYIFIGIDVSLMLSVIGAIVGEFVGAQAGLGYLIMQRNFSMDMAAVFAVIIVLSALGMALHLIVRKLQRRVVFWVDAGRDLTTGA